MTCRAATTGLIKSVSMEPWVTFLRQEEVNMVWLPWSSSHYLLNYKALIAMTTETPPLVCSRLHCSIVGVRHHTIHLFHRCTQPQGKYIFCAFFISLQRWRGCYRKNGIVLSRMCSTWLFCQDKELLPALPLSTKSSREGAVNFQCANCATATKLGMKEVQDGKPLVFLISRTDCITCWSSMLRPRAREKSSWSNGCPTTAKGARMND